MRSKEEIIEEIAGGEEGADEAVQLNAIAFNMSPLIEVLIDIRDQLEQLNTVIGNWANVEANRTR